MSVYEYIVYSNPDQAAELCNEFSGCGDLSADEAVGMLQDIANSSDEGFKQVMALHPEKDIIVATFQNASGGKNFHNFTGKNFGCPHCRMDKAYMQYNSATGMASTSNTQAPQQDNNNMFVAAMQQNTLMLVGIISLIGVGLYIGSKK